jgi:Sulfatase
VTERLDPRSVLLITLDSCRYDTLVAADAPNVKALGTVHKAHAPAHYTFASHAAIFTGFTPGVASSREAYVNPKYGKIFKLRTGEFAGPGGAFLVLDGENIVQGFKQRGYRAIGAGGVGWFDTSTSAGRVLTRDFDEFFFPGKYWFGPQQIDWLLEQADGAGNEPVFAFLNVGETHVPYFHEGADWDREENPCRPFSRGNDADKCRVRQRACLEFVDGILRPLLDRFADGSIVVCGDHGDAWGEDGLWEHGFQHEAVLTVPLVFRLSRRLRPEIAGGMRQTVERAALRLRHGRGGGAELVSGDRVRGED